MNNSISKQRIKISRLFFVTAVVFISTLASAQGCRACEVECPTCPRCVFDSRATSTCIVDEGTCYFNQCSHSGSPSAKTICEASLKAFDFTPSDKSTIITYLPISDAPLVFRNLRVDSKADLFKSADLKNVSRSKISHFRIGTMIIRKGEKRVSVEISNILSLPSNLGPNEEVFIGPQNLKPKPMEDVAVLGLFLGEVRFIDGSVWKADLKNLKAQVEAHVAGTPSKPGRIPVHQ